MRKKNKKKLNTLIFIADKNVEVHVRFNFNQSNLREWTT
jgi:hypothetical protein